MIRGRSRTTQTILTDSMVPPMDDNRIRAAARKALMAAEPLYHSWPTDQQEQFRATMGKAASNRADAVLLGELQGIACAPENAADVWRDLPLSAVNDLNWAKLLTTGIGEDMIWLNESMAENVSLLDFDTLHDYDVDDYLFQEEVNGREIEGYQKRDYYALRFPRWARLIINGRLHYATLSSLATHITDQLEEQGQDMILHLIPHEYVHGTNHGKQEKDGVLWDMQVDAGGLEQQLKELERQWYQYLQQRWIELSQSFVHKAPAVVMKDTSEHGEASYLFLFNNAAALERTRWRHFLSDCRQMEKALSEVERHLDQAWKQAESWLQETHQNILQNVDPMVTRLRKKRKIVIAPGAFDSLLRPDEDDQ